MTLRRRAAAAAVRRLAAWALGIAAVLAVFALYLRPGFLVMLADQMWACF